MASIGRNEPCPCGSGKKWKKCHGDPAREGSNETTPLQAFLEGVGDARRQTIETVAHSVPKLIDELKKYDRLACVAAIAGLTVVPENHTKIFRLDALIFLAAIYAIGRESPTTRDLERWLNQDLANSQVRRLEDPSEDVAIGNICSPSGDLHTFNGEWSNPDCYLQDVLDALDTGPTDLNDLRTECLSLLGLSNAIARRQKYSRWTPEQTDESQQVTIPKTDVALWELSQQVTFDIDMLATLGISETNLNAFTITVDALKRSAPSARVVSVRNTPLIRRGDIYIVVFPTSIPMAIVSHAIRALNRADRLGGLEGALRRVQAERTLSEATVGVSPQDGERQLLPAIDSPPSRFVTQAACRFDESKHLHIVFLHDDLTSVDRDGVDHRWEPAFLDSLGRHLQSSAERLASAGEYTGGLTLIVMGGVFREIALQIPRRFPEGWGCQLWSSADLDRLMSTEPRWRLLLWKLSSQVTSLEKLGIYFGVTHSSANLYSMWADCGYRLLRGEMLTGLSLSITIGPEWIFKLRSDGRKRVDEHCIYRPDRDVWERVRRINTHSYFEEDDRKRIYGVLHRLRSGVLEGAVETDQRAWWVDCATSAELRYQRGYIFRIWETTLNWLERIAPTLDRMIPELGNINRIVELDLSPIAEHQAWGTNDIRQIPSIQSIPATLMSGKAHLTVPMGFIAMGRSPVNAAERLFVRALVDGAVQLCGLTDAAGRAEEIMAELAIRDEQRFMHAFEPRDNRDYLRELDHEKPHLLNDEDLTFGAFGIAQEAAISVPAVVEGREDCNRTLNDIVDAFWKRCEERLREINRESLISRCLINNERLLNDLDNWQRTTRAVLALHGDRDDVLQATRSLKEKRDRTQIVHRVIVEMSVCNSPEDSGRKATEGDVDFLGSQVMFLIGTAAQSDAVRSGAVNPALKVSAAGDFGFGDDLMHIMQPYLTSHFEKSHTADASRYDDFFKVDERGTKTEREAFGNSFVESFISEYGIGPGRLAEVAVVLAEDALDQQSILIRRQKASFVNLLAERAFSEPEIRGLLKNFVLMSRERWDNAPPPFRGKDWWPWRYRRRLSLMTRPIVELSENHILYAPGFCEDSFRHVVLESYNGAFETEYFDSQVMKEYVGRVNARRGLAFNKAVGQIFHEAGWKVRTEVSMSQFGAPISAASGDIDVVAWKGNTVCLCECKELLFARTITEVSEQLARFRGNKGDDLYKHLTRVAWVRINPQSIQRIGSTPVSPEFRSLLVTSKIVPMQFVRDFLVTVLSADQLEIDLREDK